MKYNFKKIGKRIAQERKKAGFKSQQSLIDALPYSVGRNTISKLENGTAKHIDIDLFTELCKLFDCDMGYLLCEYNCKYHENADISEVTGLSEQAINNIKAIHEMSKIGDVYYTKFELAPMLYSLNKMLESPYLEDLLKSIVNYKTDLPNIVNDSNAVNYMTYNVQENFRTLLNDITKYDVLKLNANKSKPKKLF